MAEMRRSSVTRRKLLQGLATAGASTALDSSNVFADGVAGLAIPRSEDPLTQVDVFLGTGGHGHIYPGASAPFGMVQLSPDTYNEGWDWCAGYHASDNSIMGFSHTHLSGTGAGDLLDFLLVPRTGEVHLVPGSRENPERGYRSRFSHATEKAHPGYYSVRLEDTGIHAELTASEHAGFHRYTFPASASSHFVLDLAHAYGELSGRIEWASVRQQGKDTLLAGHATNAWAPGRTMYSAFQFSRPFERVDFFLDGQSVDPANGELRGKSVKAVVHFSTHSAESILVKAGLSGVDTDGALRNLSAEIPGWDFDGVCRQTEDRWRRELRKIKIETGNATWKRTFYSSLYHTMLAPTVFDDVDGRYRGMDGTVHNLPRGQRNYSTFSLWDTFRAEHPLFTLIHGDRVPDMVNCLIRMAEQSPDGMPVWPLHGKETGCMTGYHSAAVIAEACVKGFEGIDWEAAYKAMMRRAMIDDYRGLGHYRKLHFIPADLEAESVSKTFEYCYDDWAIAHVARKLKKNEDAALLVERSTYYRNYFDKSVGFIRPKFADGTWAGSSEGKGPTPFNPIDIGHFDKWRDYTESNGWQATFAAQHDPAGLIALFGGRQPFVAKLDELFTTASTLPADAPIDIAGLVGQYAHGNEPSHHIGYLYVYAWQPHKTQARIRNLLETMYSPTLDGLAGNEDCGQMSAWFILSSIGFYSVDPVSGTYVLGSPLFDRVTLDLGRDRRLTLQIERTDPKHSYIQSFLLNGQAQQRAWFHHREVAPGGKLEIRMGPAPNLLFASDPVSVPPSLTLQESVRDGEVAGRL